MSTGCPVSPRAGGKPETLQGGMTNGTANWQKEKPNRKGNQETEETDASPAQADTYRIQVGTIRRN